MPSARVSSVLKGMAQTVSQVLILASDESNFACKYYEVIRRRLEAPTASKMMLRLQAGAVGKLRAEAHARVVS